MKLSAPQAKALQFIANAGGIDTYGTKGVNYNAVRSLEKKALVEIIEGGRNGKSTYRGEFVLTEAGREALKG